MGKARLRRRGFPRHLGTQRRSSGGGPELCHPAAAAQRDRHAAHGPCVQPDHHGQPDPLPPHDGLQHRVDSRYRPRRHRHADRGGAPAAGKRHQPPRHGPDTRRGAQELRRQGVGVEGAIGQHHHLADAPHGRQRGLEPRILHHGREALGCGHRHLREAVRAGPDLPRQTPGELGPGADVRRVGPGGGKRGGRRPPVAHPVPAGGRLRPPDRGHHPPGNAPGRRGRDGAPGG